MLLLFTTKTIRVDKVWYTNWNKVYYEYGLEIGWNLNIYSVVNCQKKKYINYLVFQGVLSTWQLNRVILYAILNSTFSIGHRFRLVISNGTLQITYRPCALLKPFLEPLPTFTQEKYNLVPFAWCFLLFIFYFTSNVISLTTVNCWSHLVF